MKTKIWIVALALMAFTAIVDTVKTANADTPTSPTQTTTQRRK
jgi:hypothetical protein